jgi:hypothetical protein
MAAVGSYWAGPHHRSLWRRALEIVHVFPDENNAYHAWVGAAHYPGIVLFYSIGLAAIAAENYALLADIFSIEPDRNYNRKFTVEILPPTCAFHDDHGPAQFLKGYQHRALAMNLYLHDQLRVLFKRIYPQDKAYNRAFDKFEMLMSLAFLWRNKRNADNFWTPPGLWIYNSEDREAIYSDIADSLSTMKESSPYAKGIFSDEWADACNRLVLLKEKAPSRFARWFN